MFIRTKTSKNSQKHAVQIVESYRNEKNLSRQRIVRHLGNALVGQELDRLLDFAEYEIARMQSENTPALFQPEQLAERVIDARDKACDDEVLNVNLKKLREKSRIVTGVHEAFGQVYDELGFNHLLGVRKASAEKKLRHLTLARIANPDSKRGSVKKLVNDFGIKLSLDGVYRMMDLIDDKVIDKAQKLAYELAKNLLGGEISLLFYDCTTLYFESFTEDELKKNGYSKDLKFNQPQVVLGLLITSEGLPIGYEVFPGNQFEGHTLKTILPKIKEKYNLKRLIFTADSAMLSKKNIQYITDSGLEYIIAARLKNLDNDWTEKITSSTEKIRSFDYGQGRRLIVTYSDKLARKNKHDRDITIEKLRKKLEKSKDPATLISNSSYKRFLKIKGDAVVELNEKRYAEAAKFDGLHGVITNVQTLSSDEVVKHYRGLWQIEECFRVSKHDLRIRPIYHWTPKRIKAHLLMCFMALTCVKHLCYKVKLRFEPMSAKRVIHSLNHIQSSILYHVETEQEYVLPSRFNEDARKIYKTLRLPASTTPYRLD